MNKKVFKTKFIKLENITDIIDKLQTKFDEIEIIFEEPKEFKREKDDFINSIVPLLKHYFSTEEFIQDTDLKECIFNAWERFMEFVEFHTPLWKTLEQLEHWKLKGIDVRKSTGANRGDIVVSSKFEKSGYYVFMNFYVDSTDPLKLQIEFVIPKEIFKKMMENNFFEEVEVETWYEEYIALKTTCEKLLADKLYWQGKI